MKYLSDLKVQCLAFIICTLMAGLLSEVSFLGGLAVSFGLISLFIALAALINYLTNHCD